jgi:hypothetical protein
MSWPFVLLLHEPLPLSHVPASLFTHALSYRLAVATFLIVLCTRIV